MQATWYFQCVEFFESDFIVTNNFDLSLIYKVCKYQDMVLPE